MPTPHYYFPEEIVILILSWLPVKSLRRFASVCKLWLSIITHPEFIQTHLTNSQKRPALLIRGTIYNTNRNIGSWYHGLGIVYPNDFELPVFNCLHLPSPLAGLHVALSCNGLLCLNKISDGREIYLCNPSTMQYKRLAPRPVLSLGWTPHYTGFYFDSLNDDYRVLRIEYKDYRSVQVQLYSVKSDSWREIQARKRVTRFMSSHKSSSVPCFVIKEVLYLNGGRNPISFQLHNEVFKRVSLPGIKYQGSGSRTIFDFRGSVAIILHCCNDDGLSLWTLDDNAGDRTWTKNFKFENEGFGWTRNSYIWTKDYLFHLI